MGKGLNEICQLMSDGMKTMFMASMVMLFARSILYIMTETAVIDTVVYGLSSIIVGLPTWLTAIAMPIMVPLADLAGLNRQIAYLANQFGDGFSNFMWPTVGFLLAILAGTGIPYGKWAKWFLPLFLILSGVAAVMLVVAVFINYGPS